MDLTHVVLWFSFASRRRQPTDAAAAPPPVCPPTPTHRLCLHLPARTNTHFVFRPRGLRADLPAVFHHRCQFSAAIFSPAPLEASARAFHATPLIPKAPKQHLSSQSPLIETPWNVRSHTPSHFHTRFHSCDATCGECGPGIRVVFPFLLGALETNRPQTSPSVQLASTPDIMNTIFRPGELPIRRRERRVPRRILTPAENICFIPRLFPLRRFAPFSSTFLRRPDYFGSAYLRPSRAIRPFYLMPECLCLCFEAAAKPCADAGSRHFSTPEAPPTL